MKKKFINQNKLFYLFTSIIIIFSLVIFFILIFLTSTKSIFQGITPGFHSMMVVPNSPFIKDKGFNETLIKSSGEYSMEVNKKIGLIVPKTIDNNDEYFKVLSSSVENGSKINLSSGFQLTEILSGSYSTISGEDYGIEGPISIKKNNGFYFKENFKKDEKDDNYFIFLDDAEYSTDLSRNILKVRYSSEEAGFLAGISASIWSVFDQKYKVSTFGGMPFSTVFDWMSGYEQGVNWFNYKVLGYDIAGKKSNEEAFLFKSEKSNKKVEITNGTNKNYYVNYEKPHTNVDSWYSGSFNLGEGKAISAQQIDSGSDVIFPVAGGQFLDVVSLASSINSRDIQVIGVDSNAKDAFPIYSEKILGSAIKNLTTGTKLMLWYADKFINEYGQEEENLPNPDEENYDYDQKMFSDLKSWKETETTNTSRDLSLLSDEDANSYFDLNDKEKLKNSSFVFDEKNNKFKTNYGDYGQQLKYGSMFRGNFENGGIDFAFDEREDSKLNIAFNDLLNEALKYNDFNPQDSNIESLFRLGFLENPKIEKYSSTFFEGGNKVTQDCFEWGWIPNWELYSK